MGVLTAVSTSTPGHGECFVWQRDGAKTVAVDAGGTAAAGKKAGALDPSILVLSHDDHDHIGGAVPLIAGSPSIQELWVPVEWAILLKQIADTGPGGLEADADGPAAPDDQAGTLRYAEDALRDQLVEHAREEGPAADTQAGTEALNPDMLDRASTTLDSWQTTSAQLEARTPPDGSKRWYGAKSLSEIVDRVRKRAVPLTKIFKEALDRNVPIRFFSIDIALGLTNREPWLNAGDPGTATVANASEASHWAAVTIPPGFGFSLALTQLTVQNRRALSTLLWDNAHSPENGLIIWSDTDGVWIDELGQRGFDPVVETAVATSAPHHASGNAAHDRVWTAMATRRNRPVTVCAGAQWNQTYRTEYARLGADRCCTWCRERPITHPRVYRHVKVLTGPPGTPAVLVGACDPLIRH